MFLERLKLLHEPGHMCWHVARPFRYRSERTGREIAVPEGFETDLASVPRGMWHLMPPCGPYLEAAVVHDYLYSQGGDAQAREAADGIFLEAMAELGVGPVMRRAMWAAVRVFGGSRFGG